MSGESQKGSRPRTLVKVCGITRPEDAEMVVASGAELLGLNFVPTSPRCVDVEQSRRIVAAVNGRAEIVGVVANLDVASLNELRAAAGVDSLQLHGDEPPEVFAQLSHCDYKAVRVSDERDVVLARRYPGSRLLVDAKVAGILGGSGHTFDWNLVVELARERSLLLAGGLTPENASAAVALVRPWAIDVASGVERSPGIKDGDRVRELIQAVNTGDDRRADGDG
jgi:phosphoribosylanthranilate isomerase